MLLVQKLKQFERQVIFLKWSTAAEFVKLKYVGQDFLEFDIIDPESLDYQETIIITPDAINEVIIGGVEIGRIVAGLSSKLELIEE